MTARLFQGRLSTACASLLFMGLPGAWAVASIQPAIVIPACSAYDRLQTQLTGERKGSGENSESLPRNGTTVT